MTRNYNHKQWKYNEKECPECSRNGKIVVMRIVNDHKRSLFSVKWKCPNCEVIVGRT